MGLGLTQKRFNFGNAPQSISNPGIFKDFIIIALGSNCGGLGGSFGPCFYFLVHINIDFPSLRTSIDKNTSYK